MQVFWSHCRTLLKEAVKWKSIDHAFAHCRLILKLYMSYFPFMQTSMEMTYIFSHNLFKSLMLYPLAQTH
jgi:hypothetical protein